MLLRLPQPQCPRHHLDPGLLQLDRYVLKLCLAWCETSKHWSPSSADIKTLRVAAKTTLARGDVTRHCVFAMLPKVSWCISHAALTRGQRQPAEAVSPSFRFRAYSRPDYDLYISRPHLCHMQRLQSDDAVILRFASWLMHAVALASSAAPGSACELAKQKGIGYYGSALASELS